MTNFKHDYIVNGIELKETEMPVTTGRVLPGNSDGSLFEMRGGAIDKDGNEYYVTWIFENKGEESLDDYDYSQPDDCYLAN